MILNKFPPYGALVAAVVTVAATTAHAQRGGSGHGHGGPSLGGPVVEALARIGGEMLEVERRAMAAYRSLPRTGTCAERRRRWLAILPDALTFSRYANDVYDRNHEDEMRKAGQTRLELAPDRTAYFEPTGDRYAEARVDRSRNRIVVVFRGTRIGVGRDLATDVLNYIGVNTRYYQWASSLVADIAREHPGQKLVATGHSLGGGLALYAVLNNAGVSAVVFNPIGLSDAVWTAANPATRARVNAHVTVVSLRNFWAIEPVTALSLAGRSVLPGHVFVLKSGVLRPAKLHTSMQLVSSLEQVAANNADGDVCDGYLGTLVD